MSNFSSHFYNIRDGFHEWYIRHYAFKKTDSQAEEFRHISRQINWLKNIRQASYLSTESVAQRAGISRAAYSRIENSESQGKVTLASMNKMAAALDCEFVYGLRPKNKKRLSEKLWARLFKGAAKRNNVPKKQNTRWSMVNGTIAGHLQNDENFCRKQGWTRHHKVLG